MSKKEDTGLAPLVLVSIATILGIFVSFIAVGIFFVAVVDVATLHPIKALGRLAWTGVFAVVAYWCYHFVRVSLEEED